MPRSGGRPAGGGRLIAAAVSNITAFGGYNVDVTLAGQSAGGQSVLAQMAGHAAAGLFQRALSLSAPAALTLPTLADAAERNNAG